MRLFSSTFESDTEIKGKTPTAVLVIEATASYQCVIHLVSGDGWVVQGCVIAILLLGRICESLLVSNIYLLF